MVPLRRKKINTMTIPSSAETTSTASSQEDVPSFSTFTGENMNNLKMPIKNKDRIDFCRRALVLLQENMPMLDLSFVGEAIQQNQFAHSKTVQRLAMLVNISVRIQKEMDKLKHSLTFDMDDEIEYQKKRVAKHVAKSCSSLGVLALLAGLNRGDSVNMFDQETDTGQDAPSHE